jgi:hypothetical protein
MEIEGANVRPTVEQNEKDIGSDSESKKRQRSESDSSDSSDSEDNAEAARKRRRIDNPRIQTFRDADRVALLSDMTTNRGRAKKAATRSFVPARRF